jgi:hypothetical protein
MFRIRTTDNHLVKIDRPTDATVDLLPGFTTIVGPDESHVPAACGMPRGIEDIDIPRVWCKAHVVIAIIGKPGLRSAWRDVVETVMRRQVKVSRCSRIDCDPMEMRALPQLTQRQGFRSTNGRSQDQGQDYDQASYIRFHSISPEYPLRLPPGPVGMSPGAKCRTIGYSSGLIAIARFETVKPSLLGLDS